MADILLQSSLPQYKSEADARDARDVQKFNPRLRHYEVTELMAVVASQLEAGETVVGLTRADAANGAQYEDIARALVHGQKLSDLYIQRVISADTRQQVKVDTVKPREPEN